MIEYLCRSCGRSFQRFNALQTKCGTCAYNLHAKPRKPMKRLGKIGKQWLDDRQEWITNNPPNHQGYWECYLRLSPECLGFIGIDQLTLDHVAGRGRNPDKRRDQANFKPACVFCNGLKGSRDLEEL